MKAIFLSIGLMVSSWGFAAGERPQVSFYEDEIERLCLFYGAGYADAMMEMGKYKAEFAVKVSELSGMICEEGFKKKARAGEITIKQR